MRFGDLTTTEPALMSSYCAQFFSSSFSRSNSNQSNLVLPISVDSEDLMADCDVTFEEVEKALVNFDVYKGCGPDMIPPRVLRYCSPVLTGPIHKLFGKSLQSGVFPEALKQSYIVPIHKGGAIDNVCNYRPIAIQPTLAKIFEKLVLKKVDRILTKGIVSQQHGFFMADRPSPI
ncbi:uncharacterized protein LOC124368224 [Homalodisca vitripennis]|uniref:uncharacterized protein LOC124368224 n=1 Tax=Homalodisca vitripennis TaxID=197043 RepID=UPI001EEB9C9E|nr:uncharacterized protein LOC124368224 [Homalodisca vitripennis]